jgi:hypothetical protein
MFDAKDLRLQEHTNKAAQTLYNQSVLHKHRAIKNALAFANLTEFTCESLQNYDERMWGLWLTPVRKCMHILMKNYLGLKFWKQLTLCVSAVWERNPDRLGAKARAENTGNESDSENGSPRPSLQRSHTQKMIARAALAASKDTYRYTNYEERFAVLADKEDDKYWGEEPDALVEAGSDDPHHAKHLHIRHSVNRDNGHRKQARKEVRRYVRMLITYDRYVTAQAKLCVNSLVMRESTFSSVMKRLRSLFTSCLLRPHSQILPTDKQLPRSASSAKQSGKVSQPVTKSAFASSKAAVDSQSFQNPVAFEVKYRESLTMNIDDLLADADVALAKGNEVALKVDSDSDFLSQVGKLLIDTWTLTNPCRMSLMNAVTRLILLLRVPARNRESSQQKYLITCPRKIKRSVRTCNRANNNSQVSSPTNYSQINCSPLRRKV